MSLGRLTTAVALLAAGTLTLTVSPAVAQPPPDPGNRITRGEHPGNGPERNTIAAKDGPGIRAAAATPRGENRRKPGEGYPRQTELRVYPEDPADKSIKLGLYPYHGLAPKLNALQNAGDRVSVEVVGQSGLGRDLYLVTLTAPESAREAGRQARWRDLIEDDPVRAARDPWLRREYKAPIWINNNIHGDEWEGTDGAMRLIEYFATTSDPAALKLLRHNRIYFNVTANPDGRNAGVRQNAAGFDLNRDHVTVSQPETRAMRAIGHTTQPLVMLDEHGYVDGTLIEPTTAPHGQNYDYDLYIRHAYANALGMEAAAKATGHPEVSPVIPFRDLAPGDWDDWPPIFTPMYQMYHGAIGHTIEIPMQVNRDAYDELPVPELRRRSAINTDVAAATMRAAIDYTDRNRESLIADQIELFRRGWGGEAQRFIPDGFVPGFGPEDRYGTTFPRAWVIPSGGGQHSAVAAARLVDFLVAADIRVTRAKRAFSAGGRLYPPGSYVIDMGQPKRGLANALLEAGGNVSAKVPQMYDISGWSNGLLWGATVDVVHNGPLRVDGRPVVVADPTGGVDAAPGQAMMLRVADGTDVRAVNDLLARGLTLTRRADGTVVAPASARPAVLEVADRYGVRFTLAPAGEPGTPMRRPVIAGAVAPDELKSLRDMGFEVRPVDAELLNAGFDWSRVDTLFVSSGLSYADLTPAARAALDGFLARGGVVTRGETGAAFNTDAGLLAAKPVIGREDANGVVNVVNEAGPVAAGALPHSFVYSPVWFTDLGPGVLAEQRFAAVSPHLAGHWLPREDGTGGPEGAAGQAAVVSGVDERGARVVLFGTEPLFRDHPKGLYAQVGKAVFWAATVPAPVSAR
ncbi:zinc carboxypeptidase [Herbihabitans rhizosphaerae]|uniref:Zinc carboxypeptidase n=1 Tax=Herbihabitans rhizosphaerae TaxID=1872711 RepID=A0A4Q7KKT7_9PSEU|nr:M14 family zinc carboxypeptidase [Herbihabitans rhizosphaerae]RZS37105.1 zinc carboxypeptidase [Herbihabitans rhizosphaerae]